MLTSKTLLLGNDYGITVADEHDDFDAFLDLVLQSIIESPYKDIPFSFEQMQEDLKCFFTGVDDSKTCLLLWHEDNLVGFLIGIANNQHFLFNADRCAYELSWWVHAKHRKSKPGLALLNAFEEWAKFAGCNRVVVGHFTSLNLKKLYERRGYEPLEYSYHKEIA